MFRWFVVVLMLTSSALAQEIVVTEEGVNISGWEEWFIRLSAAASSVLQPLIEAAVATILVASPVWLRPILRGFATRAVNQLLDRGVDWAQAAVKGASKNGTITIPVANKMLAEGLAYILTHGSASSLRFLEDPEKIKQKLVARMAERGILPKASEVTKAKGGLDVKPLDAVEQSDTAKAAHSLPKNLEPAAAPMNPRDPRKPRKV